MPRHVGAPSKHTPEFRSLVCAMARTGASHAEIGESFNLSKSAVSGIVHRASSGYIYRQGLPPEQRTCSPLHMVRRVALTPAKYPFAPDTSCPDFAHDDLHCAAVLAQGGFPALQFSWAA